MSSTATIAEQEPQSITSNPENEPTDVNPEVQVETELTAEISRLWGKHRKMVTTEKKTRVELQAIREELGRKLAEIKTVVCRMGRASEWSWFLRRQAIPKATADRLVKKYGPDGGQPKKVLNEEVSLETEVLRFRKSVLKKGNQLLPHEYAKYHFIVGLAEDLGVLDEDGRLIEEPEEPEDEVEPYDDEFGDDPFMPPGDRSDEVLTMDDEEPAIDSADDLPSIIPAEQKRQIEL
jgi:hypothetical protein